MILTVSWYNYSTEKFKTITISGCPGDNDIKCKFHQNLVTLEVIESSVFKFYYTSPEQYSNIAEYFSNPIDLSQETYNMLKNILGFFPFMKYKHGEWVYANVDFKDTYELWARRKPIIYGSLLKVPIPLAILNKMQLLKRIKDSVSDLEEMELSEFPDFLRPFVLDALQKLSDFSPKKFKLEDLAVYEFLEFIDTFNSRYIISGDKLVSFGVASQAKHGQLWNAPIHWHNQVVIDDDFYPEYNPLLTDSLVESYAIHMRPVTPGGDNGDKITPLQARAMQVLLRINGYNITNL